MLHSIGARWSARALAASLFAVTALTTPTMAFAQDAPAETDVLQDDELPPPPVELKVIPPDFSWDVSLFASYGSLPQFTEIPGWMGLGIRAGWGKHFGNHRIGPGLSFSVEGPLGVEWSNNFEPLVVWEYVHPKGLWIGASAGADLILNASLGGSRRPQTSFDASPTLSLRIGFSQPWSAIARRFFMGIEPKLRIIDGQPAFIGAIVIGSGMGY